MRILTMKGVHTPRALVDYVHKVVAEARLQPDESEAAQLAYVRHVLTTTFVQRKIARAWWEVRAQKEWPQELRVVLPGPHEVFCALIVQAGPAPLTAEDLERAYDVVRRPEYWCRAKLFTALEAARVKGVLREVLDEMEISTQQADAIERHLVKHWRRS
jgi:hypothetical protein